MLVLAAIFSILLFVVSAADTTACASACLSPISELQFNGSPDSSEYYAFTCTNTLLVQSTFLCMRYYCSETEITHGLVSLDSTCETYGAVHILPWVIIENTTDQQLLGFPHIDYTDLHGTDIYSTPVFVSDTLFRVSLKTEVQFCPNILLGFIDNMYQTTWDDSLATRANYG